MTSQITNCRSIKQAQAAKPIFTLYYALLSRLFQKFFLRDLAQELFVIKF